MTAGGISRLVFLGCLLTPRLWLFSRPVRGTRIDRLSLKKRSRCPCVGWRLPCKRTFDGDSGERTGGSSLQLVGEQDGFADFLHRLAPLSCLLLNHRVGLLFGD